MNATSDTMSESRAATVIDDPMRYLTDTLASALALQHRLIRDDGDELGTTVISHLYGMFWHNTPETRSREGAAGALRTMLEFGDIEDGDVRVLRSVLAYLEGSEGPR